VRSFPLLAALLTSACAEGNDVVLPAAPSVPAASADPGLTDDCPGVDRPLGRLRGTVFTLPVETRRIPDFASLPPAGSICLDRLEVGERRGAPGFPGIRNRHEWFGVDLEGTFRVAQAGVYRFRLTSDDGSMLLVDGSLVVNNDGYHVTRVLEGAVQLSAGTHAITVPYWQGPGPMALVLEVAGPGEAYRIFRPDEPLGGEEH
jgi:hypothetical protein